MLEFGSPTSLLLRSNTTYNTLLRDLQKIWVDIGESDAENERMLMELEKDQTHLRSLQKEKYDRLSKVLNYANEVYTLCGVLGVDFGQTVSEVHPSLHKTNQEQFTNITDNTLDGLQQMIQKLKTERRVRFQKLKDIVGLLSELWNIMEIPHEES